MIRIDQVIRTRRRTLALIIQPDGRLVVRAPLRTPDAAIRAFVESKAGWVSARQAEAASRPAPPLGYAPGQDFWFLGQHYPLKLDPTAAAPFTFQNAFILQPKALPRARALFTAWYKAQALRILSERAAYFAARFNFSYLGVKITSAQSRWGSCSAKNSLNFPYRLVMAPPEVIDYVVAHELAHTREKNHARGFWNLVKTVLPDYEKRKKWLKENGSKLRLGD